MTESQVAEHVQALYSTKTTYRKTIRRTQKTLDLAERTETIGKATIPTNELLKQLNRYPALILNADYQVRINSIALHTGPLVHRRWKKKWLRFLNTL